MHLSCLDRLAAPLWALRAQRVLTARCPMKAGVVTREVRGQHQVPGPGRCSCLVPRHNRVFLAIVQPFHRVGRSSPTTPPTSQLPQQSAHTVAVPMLAWKTASSPRWCCSRQPRGLAAKNGARTSCRPVVQRESRSLTWYRLLAGRLAVKLGEGVGELTRGDRLAWWALLAARQGV